MNFTTAQKISEIWEYRTVLPQVLFWHYCRDIWSVRTFKQVSKYLPFVMLRGNLTWIRTHKTAPTCHGQFWEDDLFGAETKPLQLKIVLFPKQFEEFDCFYLDISHVPAEQAAYQNVCHWFVSWVTEDFKGYIQWGINGKTCWRIGKLKSLQSPDGPQHTVELYR